MESTQALPQALETALSGFTLYPLGHRRQGMAINDLFRLVSDGMPGGVPITLALVGDTIALNGTPLFAESAKAGRFVDRLEEIGVSSVRIEPGTRREDLENLLMAISRPKGDPSAATLQAQLRASGTDSIKVNGEFSKTLGHGAPGTDLRLMARVSTQARRLVNETVSAALDTVVTEGVLNIDALEKATVDVTRMMKESRHATISVASQAYHDHFTYNHSLNVCILASAVAESLGTSPADVNRVAQAALLHDIGKLCIPLRIVYKPGKLDKREWRLVQAHPMRGAEILVRSKSFDPLSVLAAAGHHVGYDGSGYPSEFSELPRHIVVSLIHVLDVYEAMTAQRPYKSPLPFDRVMALLLKEAGGKFHPAPVRALADTVGFYPSGSTLELANREKAYVIAVTPGQPGAPTVAVYEDPDGNRIAPPRTMTLDIFDCPPEYRILRCSQTEAAYEASRNRAEGDFVF